jgi:predicted RNA binding protein YcfA (HicA-like mRNA interferase family)
VGHSDLPVARAAAIVKTLCKFGWAVAPKRGKGSHIVLAKAGKRPLTIPNNGTVKRALLAGVLKDAGITIEEFVAKHKAQ